MPRTQRLPRLTDLFAGPKLRSAFLGYWRGMNAADWRDLTAVALLRRLPVELCSSLGALSARARGPTVHRAHDEAARANLARLRPDISETKREEMLAERWSCIGRTFAEFAVLDRLLAKGRATIEGADHLATVAAAGRGYVVLGLHLGNWEALAVAGRHGFPVSSFFQPRASLAREYISRTARERLGVKLLMPGPSGVRPALGILEKGGMVMLFADELGPDGIVKAPLFGRPPLTPSNLVYAARLAQRTGAPVVPAYVVRARGSRLRVVFEPPIHLSGSLFQDAMTLNEAIEPIVMRHLDQWFFLDDSLGEISS